jgi:glycosyltransferase involved in cell wall biosynthesis
MRVLHVLAQRPSFTGSGVTLDAVVREAARTGWEQRVVVGVPVDAPRPSIGELDRSSILPLHFKAGDLPFPVPGMSDVMPYESICFGALTKDQLSAYRRAWRRHLGSVVAGFRPHVVHSHHVWIVSSLVKEAAPDVPVVTQCHATGLRQMELCPHLRRGVRTGCARNDAFVVLHDGHAAELAAALEIDHDRVHVTGAGYRDDLFHTGGRNTDRPPALLFVGKYSRAKGLPWLLEAFERVAPRRPELILHVAGDGAGNEADRLRSRMTGMAPSVLLHGQIPQDELARLMRRATVCVLPSFYEGLPLVLVEARACGCRLVATGLPGIVARLVPSLGEAVELVELPRMASIDTPVEEELPGFVDRLVAALESALDAPPLPSPSNTLAPFTWRAVFERIERVWNKVIRGR